MYSMQLMYHICYDNQYEHIFKHYEAKAKDLKRQCNIAQFAKHQFIRLREFLIWNFLASQMATPTASTKYYI